MKNSLMMRKENFGEKDYNSSTEDIIFVINL